MGAPVTRSEQRACEGVQGFYEHQSVSCDGPMRFGVYLPPAAGRGEKVPALYYLAGLTCNEETFAIKAGAQRTAARLGLALVSCDTSPRSPRFPGDDVDWDFGQGAGFYLDATQAPWSSAYRMRSYVLGDLREAVEKHFPISTLKRGIFGHSMGGHGALTLALNHPNEFQSVSALAPIVAPSQVPWGQKAFARYLGDDRRSWAEYDAVEIVQKRRHPATIRIDQGTSDKFLERELRPELFEAACHASGQRLELRRHAGYDHSYYFIATFVEAHLEHHARVLCS
jgi:S-formylglutathione hydrolase